MKGTIESAARRPVGIGRGPSEGRRFAILEDNQARLDLQIRALAEELPALLDRRISAAMIIGSVARGCATDRSDIDIVAVLRSGTPVRADYRWWDSEIAPRLTHLANAPFPVNPVFIALKATHTSEPTLRRSMAEGLVLWDPDGIFGR